jgi:hypothetical protein
MWTSSFYASDKPEGTSDILFIYHNHIAIVPLALRAGRRRDPPALRRCQCHCFLALTV